MRGALRRRAALRRDREAAELEAVGLLRAEELEHPGLHLRRRHEARPAAAALAAGPLRPPRPEPRGQHAARVRAVECDSDLGMLFAKRSRR